MIGGPSGSLRGFAVISQVLKGGSVTIRFGPFSLDRDTHQLMEGTREVHLTPKAFDLLVLLLEERPKLLTKAVLQERLWPDTFVAEANVSNLIAELRAALADRARAPLYIRTAHGVGYAFSGEATSGPASSHAAAGEVRCWLEWDRRRIPLGLGAHVIGRDPDADVCLDHSTVSRRHARLLVARSSVVLEDFASKNGTFRGPTRVVSPTGLADGDEIRVGSVLVTFRLHAPGDSTVTVGQHSG
jgi:DNA-binding winged helix-turn-helix (wHTH) protein